MPVASTVPAAHDIHGQHSTIGQIGMPTLAQALHEGDDPDWSLWQHDPELRKMAAHGIE
jgi:hypothetical protein